jgi:hypothetical protein
MARVTNLPSCWQSGSFCWDNCWHKRRQTKKNYECHSEKKSRTAKPDREMKYWPVDWKWWLIVLQCRRQTNQKNKGKSTYVGSSSNQWLITRKLNETRNQEQKTIGNQTRNGVTSKKGTSRCWWKRIRSKIARVGLRSGAASESSEKQSRMGLI